MWIEDEVNDDRGEVTSLIDDSFEDDNNPLFNYQLRNVSRNTDEAISDFLNRKNEMVNDEVSNYCQVSSTDDEEDKTDDFTY